MKINPFPLMAALNPGETEVVVASHKASALGQHVVGWLTWRGRGRTCHLCSLKCIGEEN